MLHNWQYGPSCLTPNSEPSTVLSFDATCLNNCTRKQGVLDEVATHSSVAHSTGGRPSVLTFLDFAVGVTSTLHCLCISNWSF